MRETEDQTAQNVYQDLATLHDSARAAADTTGKVCPLIQNTCIQTECAFGIESAGKFWCSKLMHYQNSASETQNLRLQRILSDVFQIR